MTDESHTIPAAKASGTGFGIADFYHWRDLFYFSVARISQNRLYSAPGPIAQERHWSDLAAIWNLRTACALGNAIP